MTEKILLVDDEPNVLLAMQRQLRKRFDIRTAQSGEEALRLLKQEGPFAVIVSDMRMPNMNGIELLKQVKGLYPDTVRLVLTGYADQETAIEAVNSGQIFRFLSKPCSQSHFITSLAVAVHQYRLITAERDILKNTLRGCVNVRSELLGMTNPLACSAGLRIRRYVVGVAEAMHLPQLWQFEMAALLSQIGCITLPGEILRKVYVGQELTPEEADLFDSHPEAAGKLLEAIPRLENVTAMIVHQRRRYKDYTSTLRQTLFAEVLLGAQILRAVVDYDCLLFQGKSRGEALAILRKQKRVYNPEVLNALITIPVDYQDQVLSLKVDQISVGMESLDNVLAKNGALVIGKGQVITPPLLKGLNNFSRQIGIVEPIRVRIGLCAEKGHS